MPKALAALDTVLQDRYQNMVASFRIEGIELDLEMRQALDQVLAGQVSVAELKQRILAEYLGSA